MFRKKFKGPLGSFIIFSICSFLLVSCSNSVDDAKVKELEDKIRKLEDASKSSNPESATRESEVVSTQKLSVVIKQSGRNYSYDQEDYPTESSVRAEGCYDFDGISKGGSVKVLNASGKVIGLSKLSMRIYRVISPEENEAIWEMPQTDWTVFCEAYTVIDLPKSDIYQIKVGLRSAGEYSFYELAKLNWKLNLES